MEKPVKVPVIMQMEALECGAASLSMVMAYYGKWIPLEQMRIECGISRDGSNAKSLLTAARRQHMAAKAYRCEPEGARDMKFPAIIHWNFNHFVVLCGFTSKGAVLNDPARGRVTVSMEEFDAAFTGVIMTFEPAEGFEKSGEKKSIFSFVKKRMRGTKGAFIFVAVTGLLSAAVEIVKPLLSKIFMDDVLSGNHSEWLYTFLAVMGAVLLFHLIVSFLSDVYMRKIEGKFAIVSNSEFIWHVLRLPMNFFAQRYAGDLVSRQGMNQSVTNSLVSELAPMGLNMVMMVLYLGVMLKYSLVLTAVGILTVLVNLYSARLISDKIMNMSRVVMREQGKVSSVTTSGIEMMETIKASGAENGFFERWSGYLAKEASESSRLLKTSVYMNILPQFLTALANMSVIILGGFLIVRGNFTVGMLMAFQGLISSFMNPALTLINAGTTIQQMRASMERIEDVMQYEPDVEYGEDKVQEQAAKLSGNISLTNVTFGYSTTAPPLIENFNITIKPGSKIAFVGGSGCGKSTLTKLISGLYKPWSGSIEFDGKQMEEIDHMVFTGSLAVVDQDIILFEDTIANNVKMWDSSIEDFEMILAAKDAGMHEEIILRDGYNCKLTEGGKNFSGGQRQRLEIARVLAQDPTIVILDEATSALDAKTEYEVIKAIKDRGITCIIVAHRLSTIRDCDEIVVLDNGAVVERGTHESLMEQHGKYAELITTE